MNLKDYKILLDTDIGDDIDDAFALGLALKAKLDLVAVTTVFKNTKCRAEQVKQMLDIYGKDVPVYAGETYPLNGIITPFAMDEGDLATIKPCQYDDSMNKYSYFDNAPKAIVNYAKKYSKQLIVVLIGPMTNMARALEIDPSIKDDIVAIYSMGGCFSFVAPEWNVLCDPEATQYILNSGIPFYGVGFDITTKCPLDGNLLVDLRNSKDLVTEKIFTWFDRWMNYFHFEKSVLHDPLVISCLLEEDICSFEEKYCKVVLEGEKRGAIEFSEQCDDGYNLVHAAVSVNKEKFFRIIREHFE